MYKQALLDAKAVRASAMANAKASLQEAFEPRIQEMIRLKLSEELEEEGYDEMEEAATQDETSTETSSEDTAYKMKTKNQAMDEIDEASLEEILAELEELSGDPETDAKEAEEDMTMEAEEEESEEEEETEEDSEEGEGEEEESEEGAEVEDDTKIIDITLGDLKQVLQSVMGGSAEGGMEDLGGEESGEQSAEETDIDLDEILAELDKSKKKVEEKKSEEKEEEKKKEEVKKLQEAHKTIEVLRSELNEVNLLNAKLLYMNKIFKSKNLSESQKINVVSALDRASNVKEAKNIYETLKENLHSKKSQIQESRGFASNPAGVAPKKVIVEADAFVSRWQKIAGIK